MLYVDVDETLILWDRGAGWASKWKPNLDVLAYLRAWTEAGNQFVLWSSGGRRYSKKMWNEPALLEIHQGFLCPESFQDKYMRIPLPDDIFLDDDPWETWVENTIHPDEIIGLKYA